MSDNSLGLCLLTLLSDHVVQEGLSKAFMLPILAFMVPLVGVSHAVEVLLLDDDVALDMFVSGAWLDLLPDDADRWSQFLDGLDPFERDSFVNALYVGPFLSRDAIRHEIAHFVASIPVDLRVNCGRNHSSSTDVLRLPWAAAAVQRLFEIVPLSQALLGIIEGWD